MDRFQYGIASITIIEDGKWQVNYKAIGAIADGWGIQIAIFVSSKDAMAYLELKIEQNKNEYYRRIKEILDENP